MKYKCVLPTGEYVEGDIVEMTAEEAANNNVDETRFVEVEEVSEETPAVEEEAEVVSADAEISTEVIDPVVTEETTEETVKTDATPEGETVVENSESTEATPEKMGA